MTASRPPHIPPTAAPGPPTCATCSGYGIVIGDGGVAHPCECGAWEQAQYRLRLETAGIPPRFVKKTLDSYKAGRRDSERAEVLACARAYADSFARGTEDGLLLRGSTGVGKTHIAIGILHAVLGGGCSGLYCNFTDLLARLRSTYSQGAEATETEILTQMESVDLLVLDDVGAEAPTEWVRDRLYLIINRRYESARPLIVTTNCDEEELRARVGPRIVSRLYEMCRIPFPRFPNRDYRVEMMNEAGSPRKGA